MKETFPILSVLRRTPFASLASKAQPFGAANLRNGGTDESAFILNNITNS